MNITHMRVDHLENPWGAELSHPVFTWTAEAESGKKQAAARLRVSLDEEMAAMIYDSGRREEISSLGFRAELDLQPRTRYYWDIQVWADNGETAKSAAAWFETGKRKEKWEAVWITPPFDKDIHPLFLRKFFLDGKVSSARAYVCGLGLFELEINGLKCGRELLTPFCTDYRNWVQQVTFDITPFLKEGGNAVGISLGNGWYKGRFGFVDEMGELYGDRFLLLCELRIRMEDGRELVLGTDGTWLCHPSPVLQSSIYDGEVYDARKEVEGFATCGCCMDGFLPAQPSEGPEGDVRDRLSPPVTVTETRRPVQLLVTPAGEKVLDFGQEMTGWVEFDCSVTAGTEVKLSFGEILQEGNFYRDNLRTARQELVYISSGKKEHVRPHFTFFGFRYVKVEGMTEIHPEDFIACVIHSEMMRTGWVETSDMLVNRLMENTLWGQRGNFLDVPTDCPQRDERMGWTGDAQVFCGTASFHMYTPAFYRKYLRDMRMEQEELGGSAPHVVPDVLTQICRLREPGKTAADYGRHGSCAWGDAAAVIPWTMYLFYGDLTLLQEQYGNMTGWVDYVRSQDDRHGGRRLWTTGFHFGDWLALDNPDPSSSFGGTENGFVASVYYHCSALLTAKAAAALGKAGDAARYGWLAEEVKEAIRKEYITPNGRMAVNTQTAQVLALVFGLVEGEQRKRVAKDLKRNLEKTGVHLTTGFVGTPWLCPALTENGLAEYAYTLLLQQDYPSWLYEVNMGATTVWERWNSVLPDGRVSDTSMNSLNHYAYGAVAEWMYRYMCGINPSEEGCGFKRAVIRPVPDSRLKWARAVYDSAAGRYESGWAVKGRNMIFRIKIPFDAQAEFRLPCQCRAVRINGKTSEELCRDGRISLETGQYEILAERADP